MVNSHDRFYIFRISTGEIILTSNNFDFIYSKLYFLLQDLSNDYYIFDNKTNDFIEL